MISIHYELRLWQGIHTAGLQTILKTSTTHQLPEPSKLLQLYAGVAKVFLLRTLYRKIYLTFHCTLPPLTPPSILIEQETLIIAHYTKLDYVVNAPPPLVESILCEFCSCHSSPL